MSGDERYGAPTWTEAGVASRTERFAYLLRRRRNGVPMRSVAEEIGVSVSNAYRIEHQALRWEKGKARWDRCRAAFASGEARMRFTPVPALTAQAWDEVWTPERQWKADN